MKNVHRREIRLLVLAVVQERQDPGKTSRLCCDELCSSPVDLSSSPRHPLSIPNTEPAILGCIEADCSDQLSVGKRFYLLTVENTSIYLCLL